VLLHPLAAVLPACSCQLIGLLDDLDPQLDCSPEVWHSSQQITNDNLAIAATMHWPPEIFFQAF
jgi:hypothetical protein